MDKKVKLAWGIAIATIGSIGMWVVQTDIWANIIGVETMLILLFMFTRK